MFTEWKRDIRHVTKMLKEHIVWLLFYMLGVMGNSLWMIRTAMVIWQSYYLNSKGSIVDLFLFFQQPWNFGILIMPGTMLIIQKIWDEQFEGQYLISHITRKNVWGKRWRCSVILAIFFSAFLIIIQALIGRLFLGEWTNWSQSESLFYAYTGELMKGGFIKVGIVIYVMYLLKILLDTTLLSCISWNKRGKLIFWVFIVIQSGLELRQEGFPVFYQFFEVSYQVWGKNEVIGIKVLVGVIVVALIWAIGRVVTEKKDFYL